MNLKLILIVILASLTVAFLIQNVAPVEVSLLFWNISMSRALLIFFTLAIGFLLGWFVQSYFSYRKEKDESDAVNSKE